LHGRIVDANVVFGRGFGVTAKATLLPVVLNLVWILAGALLGEITLEWQ
jgi:hypothetical protein